MSTRGDSRKVLEWLVVDNPELDHLEDLLREFNLFEAIGATRQELRHSDFLRFLLDPSENHGLGDYFLKTLFKEALVGSTSQGIGAIDIDVANLADAEVERERFQIDVLVHSGPAPFRWTVYRLSFLISDLAPVRGRNGFRVLPVLSLAAMSEANKLGSFQDINACYGERPPFGKPSIRTKWARQKIDSGPEVSAAQLCSPSLPALLQLF